MEPRYGLKAIKSLTLPEKIELASFKYTSVYSIIEKVMDAIVELARNEAMDVLPSKKEERLAAMDVAFAAKRCFQDFRDAIDVLIEEHMQETKSQAARKALEDREVIEKLIVNQ